MIYIITVKKTKDRIDKVTLNNTTEVGSRIEWDNIKYLVKEIIIVNPNDGIIELKCSIIKDGNPYVKTIPRQRI